MGHRNVNKETSNMELYLATSTAFVLIFWNKQERWEIQNNVQLQCHREEITHQLPTDGKSSSQYVPS
jgi:hypothetical protein